MIVRGYVTYKILIGSAGLYEWEESAEFCFYTEEQLLDDNNIRKVLESYIKRRPNVRSVEVLQMNYEQVNTYMLDWKEQ